MHIARSILLLMTGAASGSAFVLSCGDNLGVKASVDAASADAAMDAPNGPDAAPVCDCPAAEPPLAGRLEVQSAYSVLDPGQQGSGSIFCSAGAQAISGSCTIDNPIPDKDVILKESGLNNNLTAWRCSFRNNEPVQVLFKAAVVCLKPAP